MMFSASSQVIIVTPILPEISTKLDISEFWQSFLVGIYSVMLSVFALITGPISDKIGRQRILLIGTGFMAVALALHTVAQSFILLVTMRALAGCAGGMLSGGSVAYVGDYFPYERRGWANGWIMSGTAFGQVAGVPLGKILANAFGYRWPFLMFAITMGIATILIARYVPQPEVELDDQRLTIRRALGNYWRMVKNSEVAAAVGSYFLMFFGIGLFVVFLPTWLENDIGITSTQVALLFAIGGAANVLAAPIAGRASDDMGRKPLVILSCIGLGIIMLVAPFYIDGFYSAALLFFLAMVTVGMRISPLQSLLTALVPGAQRGTLMSLAVGIGQAGIGLGSFAAGIAFVRYGYASNTIAAAVSVFLMAWLVYKGLPEPDLNTDSSEVASARSR
jgi:predicted MFS family arabinose efflux permease